MEKKTICCGGVCGCPLVRLSKYTKLSGMTTTVASMTTLGGSSVSLSGEDIRRALTARTTYGGHGDRGHSGGSILAYPLSDIESPDLRETLTGPS